uniref:Uncharacterized protein n=1 Tax=Anguilla anguilla TaxID=7936 RepID=A0A0E9WE58_ANGAN
MVETVFYYFVAMPMKGRFPIRRTLEYLQKGEIVFKNTVKIMTVNYNTQGELSDGARKFVFLTSSNSVQKSLGSNHDVQKYDSIAIPQVLP